MSTVSEVIISWYKENKRDLPWRHTKDPYKIWLSEIILQQTKVQQGLSYYLKFIKRYPSIHSLSKATEEEVMKLWQGLGYYSRARNLHFTAKKIVEKHNGIFPTTYARLLQLKGVGEYTAAAIASFCFNEHKAVLDGNVFRVISRYFGIDTPINSSEGKKIFQSKSQSLLSKHNPALHNQAIMEFGALLCKPKSPDCKRCNLQDKCVAYNLDTVHKLPVKLKKIKVKERFFNYLVFQTQHKEYILQQRTSKDIWQQLYEFPLVESNREVDHINDHELLLILKVTKDQSVKKINTIPYKHVLTHQVIYANFWHISFSYKQLKQLPKFYKIVPHRELIHYPVSVLIDNFLKQHIYE